MVWFELSCTSQRYCEQYPDNMKQSHRLRVLALLEAKSLTGSARGVLEFCREAMVQRSEGPVFEVTIATFRRGDEPRDTPLAREINAMHLSHNTISERRAFDWKIVSQLTAIAGELRPDLIWTNSVKSHFLVRCAGLVRTTPWVAYHHGYTTTDTKMLLYNQLDRWSLPAADCVLTVCRPFARQLAKRGVGREKIRVQGMPTRRFEPTSGELVTSLRRRLGLSEETTVLLAVGRLSREKGQADLLHAFRKLCNTHSGPLRLIVVGEGPERPRLHQLARDLRLVDRVHLEGQQDEVRPYYGLADIFVLPSHSEGTPNVILEAMAAGLPVVATSVGGVPEMTSGGAALLINKGDTEGLAQALRDLLRDRHLRTRLIEAGRMVLERNTPENYFRALTSVFCEVMRRAR